MLVFPSVTRLLKLSRPVKKAIIIFLDICIMVCVTWLAFSLRLEKLIGPSLPLAKSVIGSILISIPIFIRHGLYRAVFRYSGWLTIRSLIIALSIYFSIYFLIFTVIGIEDIPRSIGILQPILLFISIAFSRLLIKKIAYYNFEKKHISYHKRKALIYGAGAAGRQLVSGLMQEVEMKPEAFVDDDPALWSSTIDGLRVYAPNDISKLLSSGLGITDVIVAMPSAPRFKQREILSRLSNLPIHVKILPGLINLIKGDIKFEDFRDVEVEDILGRDAVVANQDLLSQNILGKDVLVTGAGGSIGSELCRQIISQSPRRLVLFEISEYALYTIERELIQISSSVEIVPILGSVLDPSKIANVISRFGIQTLYHVAAYKHVPIIEMNPIAGVLNNVFGTLHAVNAACALGVETFVLVSTDKAVRPTNVMGCSKRIAELILQAKSQHEHNSQVNPTKLTMVRFGNVLGSSGSVVNIFREQIKNGGPVTVTHPDIIRYFMTIPEAAQLVIQAGAMGLSGDVMVLDMGEPIKILDLARKMINLSGFRVKDRDDLEGDIEIQVTGLRPGEKLYEELLITEGSSPTSHPCIMRATEDSLSWSDLEPLLIELELLIRNNNSNDMRKLLKKIVVEFSPLSENFDLLLS